MSIKICKFDKLTDSIPPLSESEFKALKESVLRFGIKYPIKVLPDGRIIDGYHRWLILGDETPYEVIDLPEDAAYDLGIILNTARRQLSYEQLTELRERAKNIALELRAHGKTQEEAAKIVGVSQPAVVKWEKNVSNITSNNAYTPDLRVRIPIAEFKKIAERVKGGETQGKIAADYKVSRVRIAQISAAHEKIEARAENIKRLEEETKTLPPLERKYSAVVIDPPWPMKKIEREDSPAQGVVLDYPTMSLDEIMDIPIEKLAATSGCHVYLWVTQKYLPVGLEFFARHDIKYQCVLTWVKNVGFTPFSWMYSTEHVLFGTIGVLPLQKLGIRLDFKADITRHSEKPDIFYEIVREASPGPRLDMFARKQRDGFDVWGNEVNSGVKNDHRIFA